MITAVDASSITRSSATITWTTDAPASSDIVYSTTPISDAAVLAAGSQSGAVGSSVAVAGQSVSGAAVTGQLAAGGAVTGQSVSGAAVTGQSASGASQPLVITHRKIVAGLLPGTTYHFRVRSTTAAGGTTVSDDNVLVTAPAGAGPEIGGLGVRRLTATTATVNWLTASGTVAQVEFGATSDYESFTLLNVFASPAQEMLLTGLNPAAEYHFRVKAWDAMGMLNASADARFTTAVLGPAALLGADQAVQPLVASVPGGQAAAYQFTAAQSGQASLVRLFVDVGTTARLVRVALYSDQDGAPGGLISQGSAPIVASGWITVAIPPTSVVQNSRYWLAVLSPLGALSLRDLGLSATPSSVLSAQTTLAALPQTWLASAQPSLPRTTLSAVVLQVPPAVTIIAPGDGSLASGDVSLSALVDDDVPITRVQFLVDGLPVGAPLFAPPYALRWDSRGATSGGSHSITALASDGTGRSAVSGPVNVLVDNGPAISAISVSPGFTASNARVTWVTDTPADGQVEFGLTTAYGASTPVDPRLGWPHEMQLTGLLPGAIYHYRVRSRDANGGLSVSADQTFFTAEP